MKKLSVYFFLNERIILLASKLRGKSFAAEELEF